MEEAPIQRSFRSQDAMQKRGDNAGRDNGSGNAGKRTNGLEASESHRDFNDRSSPWFHDSKSPARLS